MLSSTVIILLSPTSTCAPVFKYASWLAYQKSHSRFASQVEGDLKCTSINSLSLLGAQNEDLGAASQTLLTGVRLSLWCRPIKRRTSGFALFRCWRIVCSSIRSAVSIFICYTTAVHSLLPCGNFAIIDTAHTDSYSTLLA